LFYEATAVQPIFDACITLGPLAVQGRSECEVFVPSAEAFGLAATGIGAFYDEEVQRYLNRFQIPPLLDEITS
jgi:hypothetical protein